MPTVTGTIFDLKQFAVHDGPGIRTTVFFKGCPLNCSWCHNPESRCPDPETVRSGRRRDSQPSSELQRICGCRVSAETVMEELRRDTMFYEESGGGVTFSGGEPLLQIDFLRRLLELSRQNDLHTAVDTSGHAEWECLESILHLVDLFLFDLKLMDDVLHRKHVGVSNVQIHENLKRLSEHGANVTVRMPLVPDVTDTEENVEATARFVAGLPAVSRLDILPYNKLGEDKTERYGLKRRLVHRETQNAGRMKQIRSTLERHGLKVTIGG